MRKTIMIRTSFRKNNLLQAAVALAIVAALAPASVWAASPAPAGSETDTGWRIRFYAAAIDMGSESDGFDRNGGFDFDIGGGLGFNAEYQLSKRLGIDLGVLSGAGVDLAYDSGWAGHSSRVSQETLTFTPLTVGLDVHLTPESRVDLYASPLIALVQYGGFAVRSGPTGVRTEWDFDEDLAFGASLGLGVPFGNERWSFEANLTYLDTTLEGSTGSELTMDNGFDSTIFGLGFGYRFGRPG